MNVNLNKYVNLLSESKYILLLNISDRLFSFAFFLMLARSLPREIYGEVVTLFTIAVILVSVFDLGLPVFLQREISIDILSAADIFSKVFLSALILFAAYFIIGALVVVMLYPEVPLVLFFIIAVMMYISSLVTICNKALSAVFEMKSQFISFTVPRIFIMIFFITGLYHFEFDLVTLLMVMLAGFGLNLIMIFYYLAKRNIKFTFSGYNFNHLRSILVLSLPLGLAVVFNLLYDKADVILLSKLRDFTEVAFYNIGYGVFKASSISFSFLLVAGLSRIAAMKGNKDLAAGFFRDYSKLIAPLCVLISAVMFLFPDAIINLLYTDKFSDSADVLRILSIGVLGMGLNNLTGTILNGMGYFKVVMYITLYALIMNVILNGAAIPQYGMIACAVITVITEYFIFFTEYFYFRKIIKA